MVELSLQKMSSTAKPRTADELTDEGQELFENYVEPTVDGPARGLSFPLPRTDDWSRVSWDI